MRQREGATELPDGGGHRRLRQFPGAGLDESVDEQSVQLVAVLRQKVFGQDDAVRLVDKLQPKAVIGGVREQRGDDPLGPVKPARGCR